MLRAKFGHKSLMNKILIQLHEIVQSIEKVKQSNWYLNHEAIITLVTGES